MQCDQNYVRNHPRPGVVLQDHFVVEHHSARGVQIARCTRNKDVGSPEHCRKPLCCMIKPVFGHLKGSHGQRYNLICQHDGKQKVPHKKPMAERTEHAMSHFVAVVEIHAVPTEAWAPHGLQGQLSGGRAAEVGRCHPVCMSAARARKPQWTQFEQRLLFDQLLVSLCSVLAVLNNTGTKHVHRNRRGHGGWLLGALSYGAIVTKIWNESIRSPILRPATGAVA
mmetsp:Transcript_22104/g.51543  ORF Transcript_22104/g.51543 Transcript_22104/m.51543 type:complete len:224 (-) Transcript_22104:579-1250(-)